MTALGDLEGGRNHSQANAVCADGHTIVGGSSSAQSTESVANDQEAFRWTEENMVGLGDLAGGVFTSQANDVSADGSVIVGIGSSEHGFEAFRWTAEGGMIAIGDLPGGSLGSEANAVSNDGQVVAGFITPPAGGRQAFRWQEATGMAPLVDLDDEVYCEAYGVSADGSVIVGYGTPGGDVEEATLWSESGIQGLGHLPEFSVSRAKAVSGDGAIVVGWNGSQAEGPQEAFIWDNVSGMRSLEYVLVTLGCDLSGWSLLTAEGISDDGLTIVGYGTNPDGHTEAWRAVLPPPWGPEIVAVRSCSTHDEAGTYCLEVGTASECTPAEGGSESRVAGITHLELEMSAGLDTSSIIAGHVDLACATYVYSGAVLSAWPEGSTVILLLDESLPDRDWCEISLPGMVSANGLPVANSWWVSTLEGDTSQDGVVSTLDFSAIKARFGQGTTADNFRWDINTDGIINTLDSSAVKARFGARLPDCP